MLTKKVSILLVFAWLLVALLVACGGPVTQEPVDDTPAYPPPEEPIGDIPAYPPPEEPVVPEPYPYPYPMEPDMLVDDAWSPYPAPIEPAEFQPAPGDEAWQRGEVYLNLEASQLLLMESYPIQAALILQGELPSPCHALRVIVLEPDEERRIQVEVYSLVDPAKVCAQMLLPFEARVELGSFAGAKYSVWVNGIYLADIDS